MTKTKIIKIVLISVLSVAEIFLLYFGICHTVVGAQSPSLYGVNVSYNTHFMGLYIMGICFFAGALVVLGAILFVIFFKRKPKKLKYEELL